jgi:hypothetical protein
MYSSTITVPAQARSGEAVTRVLLSSGVVAGPLFIGAGLAQAFTRDGFDLGRRGGSAAQLLVRHGCQHHLGRGLGGRLHLDGGARDPGQRRPTRGLTTWAGRPYGRPAHQPQGRTVSCSTVRPVRPVWIRTAPL